MNYNNKKDEILFLVREGNEIVEIEIGNESSFFITEDFEAPNIGAIASAPYLTMKAKEITHILVNSDYNQADPTRFRERVNAFLRDTRAVNYKFSDKHVWRHYN